jgi:NAD(P)-dependent dehydrogenase (short-subunit alcohol dehydrogenase family)
MTRNWKTALSIASALGAAVVVGRAVLRSSRYISLKEKVVLITGGSRGLGLVLAREFAKRGAKVAICARNDEQLERVRKEFADNGQPLLAMLCDVGVRGEVARLVDAVRTQLGDIDVLVNNAGTILVGPAENLNIESFEDAMQTHFWGPFYTSWVVADRMKERRFGRIVNIASIGGKVAIPHMLPYSASKFALVGYSEGLRTELAKYNIYVTTVCPGLMRTGSPRNADFTGQPEKEYAWFTLSDSLPLLSLNVRAAARKIIDAAIHGDPEVHIGLVAKFGAKLQGLAPGITAEALTVINRLLPDPGTGKAIRKGSDSESRATQNPVTVLTRRAEIANNQI